MDSEAEREDTRVIEDKAATKERTNDDATCKAAAEDVRKNAKGDALVEIKEIKREQPAAHDY